MSASGPGNIFDNLKKASQRFTSAVVDTGAKTMLKTDMVFLERDIKARKHAFGIQIYDILSMNNATTSASEIQKAFDECQRDISSLEAKVSTKREEMEAIDRHSVDASTATSNNAGSNTDEAEFGVANSS